PSQVDDNIGYLEMTPVGFAPETDEGSEYIEHVRTALSAPACGWILDLRASYPSPTSVTETMLSAVAPLLPRGPALGFRFADSSESTLVVSPDGSVVSTPDG